MGKTVRVGSRESLLAVKQAEIVISAVKEAYPDITFELVTIKTKGDKILDTTIDKIGGKGLFIKELEYALLNNEIDIAVHSYKDMPYEETEGLSIVALSKREAPFDALVLPVDANTDDIEGWLLKNCLSPVGTSSLRRSMQLKALYGNIKTAPIRGNVITRLKKLDNGNYSAIALAKAGLNRLNLSDRITKVFSVSEIIPATSQGILAVQGRRDDDYYYLSEFNSVISEYVSMAERSFSMTLGGGCTSPVAAYSSVNGKEIELTGMYADENGNIEKGIMRGSVEEAVQIGEKLAVSLKNKAVERW